MTWEVSQERVRGKDTPTRGEKRQAYSNQIFVMYLKLLSQCSGEHWCDSYSRGHRPVLLHYRASWTSCNADFLQRTPEIRKTWLAWARTERQNG